MKKKGHHLGNRLKGIGYWEKVKGNREYQILIPYYFLPIIFSLFLIPCNLIAQTYTIKGVVVDSNAHALPDAVVSIYKNTDSVIVQRFKTDKQGHFSSNDLNAQESYFLSVEYLGYDTYFQNLNLVDSKQLLVDSLKQPTTKNQQLKTIKDSVVEITGITLIPSTTLLNTTIIEADRDPIKVKGDTIEFTASSYKTAPNSTADEILKRLPGVEVNKDGTVNAQGEQVQQIYVNGKKFFGTDPKIALQNLPADAIEAIQVFDEKSDQSKFSGLDDGVRDKTINFKLKPRYSSGNFGTITAGYGTDERFDEKGLWNKFSPTEQLSLLGAANDVSKQTFTTQDYSTYAGGSSTGGSSGGGTGRGGGGGGSGTPNATPGFTTTFSGGVNYNNTASPKTEINTNYFFNRFDRTFDVLSNRQNFVPFMYSNVTQSLQNIINDNHRFFFSIDHKIDSFNSIKFTSNFSFSDNNNSTNSDAQTINASNFLVNDIARRNTTVGNGFTNSNTLLYRHRFVKAGRTFSINAGVAPSKTISDINLNGLNSYFDSLNTKTTDSTLQLDTRHNTKVSYNGTVSYTEPITPQMTIELTATHQRTNNISDRMVYKTAHGETLLDTILSNNYDNHFDHNRAGFNYRFVYKTWQLTTGVQYEQSLLYSSSNYGVVDRGYYNLLPVVRFKYTFAQGESASLDYDTNLNEPSISQLQPITDYSDPINIRVGNPDLNPEYQHRARLRYNKFNRKTFHSFFIFTNITYTTNKIQDAQYISPTFISTFKPVNVDNDFAINNYVGLGLPVSQQKLRLNFSLNSGYNKSINPINNVLNVTNKLTLGGSMRWDLRLRDTFELGFQTRITYTSSQYSLNKSLSKDYSFHDYDLNTACILPWNTRISSDLGYSFYVGSQFNNIAPIPIWNASFSKYLWNDKRAELKLSVFDILNRNIGFSRTASANYIEDDRTKSLGRYGLVSFIYNINPALLKNKTGGDQPGNGGGKRFDGNRGGSRN